ncbi:MAG: ATP synthase F1 subunit delta [Planctomycetia bacterium]
MADTTASAQVQTVFDESQVQLSRVYSEAVLNAAQAKGVLAEVVEEVQGIAGLFRDNPAFLRGLSSGASSGQSDAIIVKSFSGKVHELVLNLLRVLNNRGRIDLFAALADRLTTDSDRLLGRCRVSVTVASQLSSEQHESLKKQLQDRIGLVPSIDYVVDPSLIGGLVIRVGDLQFDSSIRSRLEQLRNNLLQGKIHEIQSRRDQLHTSA